MDPRPEQEPLIYLDHHATTPVAEEVVAAMQPYWIERFGNASSIAHWTGINARHAVELAQETIAAHLDCDPEEIIFTSGATESNNLVLKGLISFHSKRHLIVNAAEHAAVLQPAKRLQRQGCAVTIVDVDPNGRVSAAAIDAAIQERTALVSVMLVNNEVGSINPVAEIAELCHSRGVLVHCDASQALGRLPISVNELGADLISFTAHKVYGPQGVGALYVKKQEMPFRLQALIDGGGQQLGLRSGTLPVALIAGFAAAVKLVCEEMATETVRQGELRDQLWQLLQSSVPGIRRNGSPDSIAANLNVTLPEIDGDRLLSQLAQTCLCVSSGAACSSTNSEPSHVLRAMGLTSAQAKASLRFGLGRGTTLSDITRAAKIVAEIARV